MAKIDQLIVVLMHPWVEHYPKMVHPYDMKKEDPRDPGYAVFEPTMDWATDRAKRLVEQGVESVPEAKWQHEEIAKILLGDE